MIRIVLPVLLLVLISTAADVNAKVNDNICLVYL